MAASAGRVLLIPKGTYNAATTYNMLDIVYYDGATYVCKQTSLGNLPTDTDYWQLMASSSGTAAQVSFDPTGTGLVATNVQNAVVEVNNKKSERIDITSIIATGATNTTGATITAGTYFYLNGALVKAKVDIASGASYTSGTNYGTVTVSGELTALNSSLTRKTLSGNNQTTLETALSSLSDAQLSEGVLNINGRILRMFQDSSVNRFFTTGITIGNYEFAAFIYDSANGYALRRISFGSTTPAQEPQTITNWSITYRVS